MLNKLQSQKGSHKKVVRVDFLAFSEPSSQNQWEIDWADMNFKKIAIWTTLQYTELYLARGHLWPSHLDMSLRSFISIFVGLHSDFG